MNLLVNPIFVAWVGVLLTIFSIVAVVSIAYGRLSSKLTALGDFMRHHIEIDHKQSVASTPASPKSTVEKTPSRRSG